MYRAKKVKACIKKKKKRKGKRFSLRADNNSYADGKQIHVSGSHYVVNV